MGQPTPPGDIPLIQGLGTEWNELVGYIPEDKRAEFGPKLQERVSGIEKTYEPYKAYADFVKSGIQPDQISTALNVLTAIQNNPQDVYNTIGRHLGVTPQEVKEAVESNEEGEVNEDPRIAKLQQQVDTLSQIYLTQHQQSQQEQEAAKEDARLEKEITELKKSVGDFPEDEIIMRMIHKGMSAADAYAEYNGRVTELMKRRPAPFVLGGGGNSIPRQPLDVTKLDGMQTRDVVTQMIRHANEAQ